MLACSGNLAARLLVRPRRRRLELIRALTFNFNYKIIRLISRRVAIFPAAAARQIFDGDCDAANRKKNSGVIPPFRQISDPVGSSVNGQKSSILRRQNPA